MTQEEVYSKVIEDAKWEMHPDTKWCKNVEISEIVCFWDENVSFCVHALRKKNEKPYVYAIYQSKPISKRQDTLDDIDIDWDNNNLKSMVGNELIKNKTLHNEFLKKNEENSI